MCRPCVRQGRSQASAGSWAAASTPDGQSRRSRADLPSLPPLPLSDGVRPGKHHGHKLRSRQVLVLVLTHSRSKTSYPTWMLFQGRKRVESSLKVLYYEYYTWRTHPPSNQNFSKNAENHFKIEHCLI